MELLDFLLDFWWLAIPLGVVVGLMDHKKAEWERQDLARRIAEESKKL